MKIERKYHRYEKWEDFKNGMFRSVDKSEKESIIRECFTFISDTERFGKAMRRVIYEWPHSCEQNLTATNSNRRAWIGQAAACIEINCPEDITRHCWGMISEELQKKANKKADKYILEWSKKNEGKSWQIHIDMGGAWIPGRNTRRS